MLEGGAGPALEGERGCQSRSPGALAQAQAELRVSEQQLGSYREGAPTGRRRRHPEEPEGGTAAALLLLVWAVMLEFTPRPLCPHPPLCSPPAGFSQTPCPQGKVGGEVSTVK